MAPCIIEVRERPRRKVGDGTRTLRAVVEWSRKPHHLMVRDSKKHRRERENHEAIGGTRSPQNSIAMLPQWRTASARIRTALAQHFANVLAAIQCFVWRRSQEGSESQITRLSLWILGLVGSNKIGTQKYVVRNRCLVRNKRTTVSLSLCLSLSLSLFFFVFAPLFLPTLSMVNISTHFLTQSPIFLPSLSWHKGKHFRNRAARPQSFYDGITPYPVNTFFSWWEGEEERRSQFSLLLSHLFWGSGRGGGVPP